MSNNFVTIDRASAIMGENFYEPGRCNGILPYGCGYTEKEKMAFCAVPFSELTLGVCRESHVLFVGFPMSIIQMQLVQPQRFSDSWYADDADPHSEFAWKEKTEKRWYLMRRDGLPYSSPEELSEFLVNNREKVSLPCEGAYSVLMGAYARPPHIMSYCKDSREKWCSMLFACGPGIMWFGGHSGPERGNLIFTERKPDVVMS